MSAPTLPAPTLSTPTLSTPTLPTKDKFVANHLEAIQHCDICHERFDEEHIATRIRGPNQCQHIFGSTCLQQWMDSDSPHANSCPKCREVLFKAVPRPTFMPGVRPGAEALYLEHITRLDHAWLFVNSLREITSRYARTLPVIYDSDLEDIVSDALVEIAKKYLEDTGHSLLVGMDTLLTLREVAREMMMSPLEDRYTIPSGDRVINAEWFSRVAGVLGWNLQ